MIASLHGRVESIADDWAIINVNGIGFQVHMPTSTLSTLGSRGQEVHIYTHLHLREDNVTLFGFASPEELGLFETLIEVSGIGPRLALSMLSAMSIEQLTMAIATGNADLLTAVPGIGKKIAARLVLELKDKIGAELVTAPAAQLAQENADVLAALTSLGYSVAEASRAVASLPSTPDLTLEEKIRLALGYFTGK
jgi:Holliday junction DNA helicase RuvA